jgi:mycofactocin system transcriptional regulator
MTIPSQASKGRPPVTSRARIESAAFGLFSQHGFSQTTVTDIATAAGIAPRTFFRYYPSKADLVWEGIDTLLAARLQRCLSKVPAATPVMQAIQQAVTEAGRLPPHQQAPARRRLTLVFAEPDLLAGAIARSAPWRAIIAEFAAARLGLRPGDLLPTLISCTTYAAMLAACEHWLRDDHASLEHLLDRALGELAYGIGRAAPAPAPQPAPEAGTNRGPRARPATLRERH